MYFVLWVLSLASDFFLLVFIFILCNLFFFFVGSISYASYHPWHETSHASVARYSGASDRLRSSSPE